MRKIFVAVTFLLSFFFESAVIGQQFTLVRDINRGPDYDPPQPTDLTEAGGLLFFRIERGPKTGVWKTDGSDIGTEMINVLTTGEKIEDLSAVNDEIFFVFRSYYPNISVSLGKSDGTSAGSVVIKTIPYANISSPTSANGLLFFIVTDWYTGRSDLWKSDGTEAGTILLKAASSVANLINVNGTLFFTATEDAVPYQRLWKSDGTVAGTVLIKDVAASAEDPYFVNFFNGNGTLFFTANDRINGEELWKSNGTSTGTEMVKDIEPGPGGCTVYGLTTINSNLYFLASTSVDGYALWASDGTLAGTNILKKMETDPGGDQTVIVNVNGILFFAATDSIYGNELWKSDGTSAGTILVKDIAPGSGSSYPSSLSNLNGVLCFTISVGSTTELWTSDGTVAGTFLLKGGYNSNVFVSEKIQLVTANGVAYFSAFDDQYGFELWKTNGTPGGTVMVKNVSPNGDSAPQKFVAAHGLVYFSAFNYVNAPGPVEGRDAFQTDGTFSGTFRAERINGRYHSYPLDIINHNGILFLSGTNSHNNGYDGYELYKISSAGEKQLRVKDINPAPDQRGSVPHNFRSVGQYLYFSADDKITGFELWKTDGTEEGTVMVKDINPNGDSNPENLVNVNGTLFFTAYSDGNGIELWKSDGTDAGTVLVKNINLYADSNPSFLTPVNGVVYFIVDDGVNGVELWKSNGTESGTIIVKNIKSSGSSNPAYLTNVNGTLFFTADDGINGIELWKTDGTSVGTVLVKDIRLGNAGSNPAAIVNLNGIIFFSADNGTTGRELWKSNGTSTGTVLAADVWPGENGSNPAVLTKIGNNILFAANNGINGNEVWVYNANGARLMSDLEPGLGSSDPTEFFEYGSKVLAAASNSIIGSELWIANIPSDIPIGPDATITAAGPLAICSGQNVQLKANTGTGYTYQWKKAGVNIAGAIQSSFTANVAGYYTVVVTDAGGTSATSEVAIVTIVNAPLATVVAAGPIIFCAGKNVLLKATTATGYTYQWKKAGVNIDNATSSNYTATIAGAYSVVVTNATGCSATSALINVVVNAVPLANVAAASALTFCEGKTVQLKAITGTGYTYQWKRGGADIAGATSSNYNASATGYYTVIVTNATGCFTTSTAMAVVVKPLPTATITAAGPTTFCSGKNVLLRANTGTNYTYQWLRGATPIPGATQVNYSAAQVGYYSVIVTNSSGCSVTSAAVAVSVNPLPVATITPSGPLTFCSGQSLLLKANTGTNYSYQWKKAGVNIPDATLVSYTAATSGIYSVVVTNAGGCSVTSPGVTVTVNGVPLATVVAASATTFCAGKNVLLKAINATGYKYQWRKNGVNIPHDTTSNYTATATGVYSVVVTNVTGCSNTSIGIPVTVNMAPLATVAVAGPLTFCEGKNVLLKAIAAPGYTYQWKKNGINISAQTQSTYTATATGMYTVMVTSAQGCSTLSTGINVTVIPAPAAIITANGPLTFPQGGSVTLNASAATGNVYQWKKDGINITGAISESYSATAGGTYTVVVTNAGGCQSVSQPTVVAVTPTRPITKNVTGGEDLITVYPNPMYRNDFLNIDRNIAGADKSMLVTIYDMTGRQINSRLLTATDRTIKITGASGMYMIECRWGINKRKVFSVIKIE